jgi:hypothetical protein
MRWGPDHNSGETALALPSLPSVNGLSLIVPSTWFLQSSSRYSERRALRILPGDQDHSHVMLKFTGQGGCEMVLWVSIPTILLTSEQRLDSTSPPFHLLFYARSHFHSLENHNTSLLVLLLNIVFFPPHSKDDVTAPMLHFVRFRPRAYRTQHMCDVHIVRLF